MFTLFFFKPNTLRSAAHLLFLRQVLFWTRSQDVQLLGKVKFRKVFFFFTCSVKVEYECCGYGFYTFVNVRQENTTDIICIYLSYKYLLLNAIIYYLIIFEEMQIFTF